jgi:methyl-accepting chemotaxis protein
VASGFSALSSELAQTTSEHTTSVIEKLEAAVSTLSQALVENGRQASELLTQTSNELSSLLRSRTKLLGWVLFFQLLSIGAAGISIFLSLRP